MTEGERLLLNDLNEFVRQTSDLLEDEPQTSGIQPPPRIEVTETTLDTVRFGFEFGPKPEAQVEPNPGSPLMGACCFDDGTCEVETAQQCIDDGGTYQGDNSDCDPNPCGAAATGACCIDDNCSVIPQSDCEDVGGIYLGDGTDCDGVDCTCCPFFTFYSTIKMSGTITGCDGGTRTLPEQTWTKVAYPPINPYEFAIDSLCQFKVLNCNPFAEATFLVIYGDDFTDCFSGTGLSFLSADFSTADGHRCGPFVNLAGEAEDCCTGAPAAFGPTGNYDLSEGTLDVSIGDSCATFNLHLELS